MVTTFSDDDADPAVLRARHVAVLGYGDQGHAHALNLRDSGVDVRVGLRPNSPGRSSAESEGLRVLDPEEAVEEADTVALLVPDHRQAQVYADVVEPNLVEGDALVVAHGFAVRSGAIVPPGDVDVVLVAPRGPGHLVRREYSEGRGVPALVAVEQDASGLGWDLALAYARAIGGLRAGGLKTTFAEESATTLFAAQAIGGGVARLLESAVATLVDAGYQPAVARLACLRELERAASSLEDESPIGAYGRRLSGERLVSSRVEGTMRALLAEVANGSFARGFLADQARQRASSSEH